MLDRLPINDTLRLLECCPFGILVLDDAGDVRGYNQTLVQLVGSGLAGLGDGAERDARLGTLRPLLQDSGTIQVTGADGCQRFLEVTRTSLPSGDPVQGNWDVRFYFDVSGQAVAREDNRRLRRELQDLALTEPTTGLLNRRGLVIALEPQVARSRRYEDPLSVMMLEAVPDLDGNSAVVHFSRMLKDQLRWADLVACTDTREFILALPETGPDDAVHLAKKLSRELHALEDSADNGNHGFKLRCGITAWHKGDDAVALLKRASAALNQARSTPATPLVQL